MLWVVTCDCHNGHIFTPVPLKVVNVRKAMADSHSNVSISGADGDDARVEAVGHDRPDAGREGRQVEEPRFAVEVERANEPVLRNEK